MEILSFLVFLLLRHRCCGTVTDIDLLPSGPGAQQQTRYTPLLRSIDVTDRQTDTSLHPFERPQFDDNFTDCFLQHMGIDCTRRCRVSASVIFVAQSSELLVSSTLNYCVTIMR